ncbi:hypothetical protein HAX54_019344, partial [Datura stramonium]|nr:hypothetical protein [Datura stramonium]
TVSSMSSGILKLAHMAHDHNDQLDKIAKVIPPMIQHAIGEAAMKLSGYEIRYSLCP